MSRTGRRAGVYAALAAVSLLGAACAGNQPKDAPTVETGGPATTAPVTAVPGGGSTTFTPPPSGSTPSGVGRSPAPRTASASPRRSPSRPPTAPPRLAGPPPVPAPGGIPSAAPGGNPGPTDVGVTGDTIKLGGFFSESGPAASLGVTALKAARALYNEVNAQGGLYGRKIQLVDCDTSSTAGERAQACFSKLTDEDKAFAFASAGDGPAMVTATPLICKAQVPALWMDGLASDQFRCPFVFPAGPPAQSQAHVVAEYHATTRHPKTVGILVENDAIGDEWAAAAKETFARNDVKVVSEQRYDLGESNLTGQVTGMRLANPDFVFFASEPLGGILFSLQARSQGWTPPLPAAGVTCDAEIWPRELGSYAKGTVCPHPWFLPQDGFAEHAVYERTYKKYWNDWDQRTAATEIHWTAAKAVVETLRAAGPNLTRQRVLEVLRGGALNGFDTGFGVRFRQASTPGGNVFDTEVAIVEITEPSGNPSYYTLRQKPAPDPHFKR